MSTYKEIWNEELCDFLRKHPLVRYLRGRVWHVTSPENYWAICRHGSIEPNRGHLRGQFKRGTGKKTLCEKLGAVSLFDFDQPDERIFPLTKALESVGEYVLHWSQFPWLYEPISMILLLDAVRVRSGFAEDKTCKKVGGQWIYNVEACHIGPISFEHVEELVIVRADAEGRREGQFETHAPSVTREEFAATLSTWGLPGPGDPS